jgi:hypothetical protein
MREAIEAAVAILAASVTLFAALFGALIVVDATL